MTAWLLSTFPAVSALMLAVLLLRRPVARWFGANWAYSLWLVPALRVLVPPLGLIKPDIDLPAAAQFIPAAAGGTALLPAAAGPGQWVPFLLAMWAGGAVIFLILQWLGYRAFLRRLDASSRPARPPRYGGILTFVSDAVEGPLALGLRLRRIVIPADFSRRYNEAERRLAMEHELTHHRRGDLWCNMAAMLLLAANWFNPLAWIAYRAYRADQELACDAAVAARASAAERCAYATALVKSASASGLIAACSMSQAAVLKRRLRMMRLHRVSGARSAGGLAAVGALSLAAFALGSPDKVGVSASFVSFAPAAAPEAAPFPGPAQIAVASEPLGRRRHYFTPPRRVSKALGLERARPSLASAEIEPKTEPLTVAFPARASHPAVRFVLAQPMVRTRFVVRAASDLFESTPLDAERKAQIHAAVARALAEAGTPDQALRLAALDAALAKATTVDFTYRSSPQGD